LNFATYVAKCSEILSVQTKSRSYY